MEIVLASKSPRRRELLSRIFADFKIESREVDESLPQGIHPREGVELLAVRKGRAVADGNTEALVISSDTLVELDSEPLGKPESKEDAFRILRKLSGRVHNVHTGVAVHYKGRVICGVDSAQVSFRQLSDEEIYEYIDTGEPMDKAGAYGIQGLGGRLVLEYNGDFDTIVGLSLPLTQRLISAITEDSSEGREE